jgi:hypothetical protein
VKAQKSSTRQVEGNSYKASASESIDNQASVGKRRKGAHFDKAFIGETTMTHSTTKRLPQTNDNDDKVFADKPIMVKYLLWRKR